MNYHVAKLKQQAGKALLAVAPSHIVSSQARKRVIAKYADSVGLVYFGFVDQRSDEHRLVRGLTVSANHRDHHYCIGSINGYDLILLERTDTITVPQKPHSHHTWLIAAIDLHTPHDLPHMFLGTANHSETFYSHLFTTFATLGKVPLGAFGQHSADFVQSYNVYTPPSHAIFAEQLLTPDITSVIAAHFQPLAIEISDGTLYIYADNHRPTTSLLDSMVKNGLWLAAEIDKRAALLQ